MIYSNKSVFPYSFLNLHKPHIWKMYSTILLKINNKTISQIYSSFTFWKAQWTLSFGTCSLWFLRYFICKFLQHSKTTFHRTIYIWTCIMGPRDPFLHFEDPKYRHYSLNQIICIKTAPYSKSTIWSWGL